MWHRIVRRSADPVPIAVLSLLHHLSDLRRGIDLPYPIRGRFYGLALWRFCRDFGFPSAVTGRAGLGLGQRVFKLGKVMDPQMDEGLRSELQKQGIWVTSMQE